MKVLELGDNFKFLSVIEKRDYLKNILKDNSLKVVINFLIVNNSDIIENFENLSVENIIKKIDILMKLRKSISNNVNLNLLIDKLILSFEKVNV